MKYSILLTVKKPPSTDREASSQYDRFVYEFQSAASRDKTLLSLTEDTVLIPIDHALNDIGGALKFLGGLNYTYAVLPEDVSLIEVEAAKI